MVQKKIDHYFISEFDKFFHAFDLKREKLPESRIKEIEKHRKIFHKRDHAVEEQAPVIWKEF